MALFRRREKTENIVDENSLSDILLRAVLGDEYIDREKAKSLPAVNGWLGYLCDIFAMIPFKLYSKRKNDDGKVVVKEITDDPRVQLINTDTGDTFTGAGFKRAMCEDYFLDGNGYAYINRRGNNVLSINHIKPSEIEINKISIDPIFKDFDIYVGGAMYDDFDFIKLIRNTDDGINGYGITEELTTALRTAAKRLIYDFQLAATGGSRKGFIKSPKKLGKIELKELKNAWEEYYAGNSNTVILNNGLDFQEASNTSRENEIADKQRHFGDEVKIIFHIGANYDETIKQAIQPIATYFAAALNKDLLLEEEKGLLYFEPYLAELYKGSIKERFEAYAIAIEKGFKTRNEIRQLEGDNYIKGLDTVNLGLGDVLLDADTGEIYTPNTGETHKFGEQPADNAANAPSGDGNGANPNDITNGE